MWAGYCDFYAVEIPQHVTDFTWNRISADVGEVRGLLALDSTTGTAVGFANYIVHPYTWSEQPACYLEDLFVRPAARGSGAGRKLLERLMDLAQSQHWSRVYWMTRENNGVARRLYDAFAAPDDFIRYVVDLPNSAPR